jgi:hypothetical protein
MSRVLIVLFLQVVWFTILSPDLCRFVFELGPCLSRYITIFLVSVNQLLLVKPTSDLL